MSVKLLKNKIMKKLLTLSLTILMIPSVFAADVINIINATTNYTLYFNTVTKTTNCYPEIREYYPSGISGNCTLGAGSSIDFSTYA